MAAGECCFVFVVVITGSVSGTTIVAYDAQGSRVASATPTGTPPNRVFSIVLPVGGTYVLFLVENEGTVNQRVFPLYADGSLTTNRIPLAEPGTIDLGFVDTSPFRSSRSRATSFRNCGYPIRNVECPFLGHSRGLTRLDPPRS